MWLSRQMKLAPPSVEAELGVTTIAGGSVGAVTRGEIRALPIYGPGGYVWLPESGAGVLVVKGGPGGQEQCVAGMKQAEPPAGMQPGEVCIQGPGGSAVYLKKDGIRVTLVKKDGSVELKGKKLSLTGSLFINGKPYAPSEGKEDG